jgi:phage tail-like protein
MPGTGAPLDPVTSFRFHVEIGDISEAAFSECSGLQAEIQVEEYLQGGANDTVYRLPGRARFTNVTLRRGITTSDQLWSWWKEALRGRVTRKEVSIVLHNQKGDEMMRWTLSDAFPVKWVAPALRAGENIAAVEALELAYQGLRLE